VELALDVYKIVQIVVRPGFPMENQKKSNARG